MNELYIGFYVVAPMLLSPLLIIDRGTVGWRSYRCGGGLRLIAFLLEIDKIHRVPRSHSSPVMVETVGSSETSAHIRLHEVES
jgi:hypothetical protein